MTGTNPTNQLVSLAQRQTAIAAQQAAFMHFQGTNAITTAATSSTATGIAPSIMIRTTNSSASGTSFTNCSITTSGQISIPSDVMVITSLGRIDLDDAQPHLINLPDGTEIDVKADGSFEIRDANAKVTYRAARIREFNPFINASDRLEEFVAFCGEQAVHRDEMLELPLKLFIGWLVLQAAKADKEPEPEIALIPDLRRLSRLRCRSCQRFLARRLKRGGIEFCSGSCFERARNAMEAAA